jgi:hypothetical protein
VSGLGKRRLNITSSARSCPNGENSNEHFAATQSRSHKLIVLDHDESTFELTAHALAVQGQAELVRPDWRDNKIDQNDVTSGELITRGYCLTHLGEHRTVAILVVILTRYMANEQSGVVAPSIRAETTPRLI